jgi:hypothetical protein
MNLPNGLPQEQSPSTVAFDPKMLEGADWETLNSLAYKFQGEAAAATQPMQLAAGGISFQTQRAINELDRDYKPAPKSDAGSGAWSEGKDSKVIEDFKARQKENKERQDRDLQKMLDARKKKQG